MAFWGRSRKDYLRMLATELGLAPLDNLKIIELKYLITNSDRYDEEFVKDVLSVIVEERTATEKQKAVELEEKQKAVVVAQQREREFELEEMKIQLEKQKLSQAPVTSQQLSRRKKKPFPIKKNQPVGGSHDNHSPGPSRTVPRLQVTRSYKTEGRNPIQCYECGTPGVLKSKCPTCMRANKMETAVNCMTLFNLNSNLYPTSVIVLKIFGEKIAVYVLIPVLPIPLQEKSYLNSYKGTIYVTFTKKRISFMMSDGIRQTIMTLSTVVDLYIEDKVIPTEFLVLSEAKGNKTLLGLDFLLKAAGIVIDVYQEPETERNTGFVAPLRKRGRPKKKLLPGSEPRRQRNQRVSFDGASGPIKFQKNGQRTFFTLDVVKVTSKGVNKIATWDPVMNFHQKTDGGRDDALVLLKNATLRVTTIINSPYLMKKVPEEDYTGNDRYEGYCKDLLEKLSEKFGFKFVINPVKDGKYGAFKDGAWNGMVGELLRMEADIAVADLSITFDRESAVDFTMPFMNLGISILFKKPGKKVPALFSFLKPLSIEVWFYMGTAYLGITLYLFILARLSPYEWIHPRHQPDSEMVANRFTLVNSLWFMMGSLMKRGCAFLPSLFEQVISRETDQKADMASSGKTSRQYF
ncbi:glutamate receptor ionotropic, kainate 2 [Trichonephila inaurata madagascariensis]|uniref:Glutamate receptor ionotropic, kainate 2 n=1 Tax=Trichonephila inaurata madagascariensis TaxID=2747483 RepID=A0A8X7C5M5_9ARAC|nr:glutamate receptor ionotropic, kainate 2 [Trichonephila inaurata madagascariensis]